MTEMFKVQDNWPLPPIRRTPRNRARVWPVEGMRVGQMFFLPRKNPKHASAYTARVTKDLPGKYTTRRCWALQQADGSWLECKENYPGAVPGVGVWREE